MSERLSKLMDYLEEGNYDMAITVFAEHPEKLSQDHTLELARAFIVNEKYTKAIELVQNLIHSPNPAIYYDARLLLIKAKHLMGEACSPAINEMIDHVKNSPQFQPHHVYCLEEILNVLNWHSNHSERIRRQSNEELRQFKRHYDKLFNEAMDEPLQDGMPMYLVSENWYVKWKSFIEGNGEYPGIISHFEILDHRYNSLWDPQSQKKYTNYHLYPEAKIKAITKECWLKLKDVYFGLELKRYNVWVNGKPREVMTEIHLRKISVRKEKGQSNFNLLISKKENFKAVNNKLKKIWGEGALCNAETLKPVKVGDSFEEIDTFRKVYIYRDTLNVDEIGHKSQVCPVCQKRASLKFCQCKSIKYCSLDCLIKDRDQHRKKCELELSHMKQQEAIAENFELAEKAFGGKKGIVGLRNLGNTCYMNSGLQCMSNSKEITEYFMNNKFLKEINQNNPLGMKGNLACAYAELIRSMWTGSESAISPFTLKKMIGKFAGQFSGYGQQDSQEFISFLIDGLQEDLNLVKKKETFDTNDELLPDEEGSKLSEMNYSKRIRSYIRDLMSGQFKSTVICSKCKRKSVCFDPYLLIPLQIPFLMSEEKDVYIVPLDPEQSTMRANIYHDHITTIKMVRNELEKRYVLGKNYLTLKIVCLETQEVYDDNISDSLTFEEVMGRCEKYKSGSILAYETKELNQEERRYKIDYFYRDKKIGYPRFLNIPYLSKPIEVGQILWPSVERFSKSSKASFSVSSAERLYKEMPQISDDGNIKVRLNENLSMLKCKTDDYKFKLYQEKKLTLARCLSNFTKAETLEDHNEWYCNKCKEFVRASKQMEIYKSNKILVMAFKRFNRGRKIQNFIDFPITDLDMGPYIKSNSNSQKIMYELYGIVNHYGSMGGGHYTAYCKNFLNNNWYQFDDSRVNSIRAADVVTESAYVVFYRRRD